MHDGPDTWYGRVGITDDVIVNGKGDEEHNRHLHKQMEVAIENGLVFNGGMCVFKQPSVTYFGCVYDMDREHLDSTKASTVHNMPLLETPTQLQKVLIIVIYQSPFVSSPSSSTAPLHKLLKKGMEVSWNESY